ncbi:hypothetical protein [Kineococcus sp. NPDC059986]|uniref:hypothetical protein n=1 Tax=Kineococcus sp. NPDC059986 TaxID=3155538 RepID=UPI0034505F42
MKGDLLSASVYGERNWGLCPREALEHRLRNGVSDYAQVRDEWSRFLERARTADDEREIAQKSGVCSVDPPEGVSWTSWAEWLERRLTEVAADPSTLVTLPQFLSMWRPSTARLDPTAGEVVRRAVAGVSPPEGGSVRDYVVVEAAGTVGVAVWPSISSPYPELTFTRELGVVVERTDRTRVVAVNAVDPWVDERFSEWSIRWPALTAALGGWFSDAALGRNGPWSQQRAMLERESDEHLTEIAREATDLLHLDDEVLRHFAVSAGSCVLPQGHRLRCWFGWMVWRIETFKWKKPV